MKNPTICILFGTRPEIIKMAPVIRACQQKDISFFLIHTGQHYSYYMDQIFLRELGLPLAQYHLEVGSGSHAQQTGIMLPQIEKILFHERPDIILLQGDTNTVLAGAIASSKSSVRIGHVEAGLRSYDRRMPEEINRVLTDHVSDFLFAPTDISKNNLLLEGIAEEKIFVTGNTIVDSILQNTPLAKNKSSILKQQNLRAADYFLLTAHRAENVDSKEKLQDLLFGMKRLTSFFDLPLLWPIHPRTKKTIELFGLQSDIQNIPRLVILEPLGFWDFLTLLSSAKLVLTDSGGMQEETCILQIPCITLRENTERPETLAIGSNILVGTDPEKILLGAKEMLAKPKNWDHPFGNGKTGEYIIDILARSHTVGEKVERKHFQMNSVKL